MTGLGKRGVEDLDPMQLDEGGNFRFSFESSKRSRGTWSTEEGLQSDGSEKQAEREATSLGAAGQLTGAEERVCQEP